MVGDCIVQFITACYPALRLALRVAKDNVGVSGHYGVPSPAGHTLPRAYRVSLFEARGHGWVGVLGALQAPIYADESIVLEWLVVRVTPNPKLKGDVVELRGRIKGQNGDTALGAKGKVLVSDRL